MSIQAVDFATLDRAIQGGPAPLFEAEDILWTLGSCVASLSLTPFVAFYLLLVA